MREIVRLFWNDAGATAAEYSLILAIVGGAVALASVAMGSAISNAVNRTTTDIETCGGSC